MKRSLIGLPGIMALFLLTACGSKNDTLSTAGAQDAAKADSAAGEYTVSAEETVLEWKVTEKMGGGHNGRIDVNGGSLRVSGNELEAGKFDINMNAIRVDDVTDPQKNAKLVGHLKNDDFFATDRFPKAVFEITAVEKGHTPDSALVKGNLTIKDITKNISIPARLSVKPERVDAAAAFSIDRTEWDIRYKSAQFFADLGDNVINDAIEFKLALTAKK